MGAEGRGGQDRKLRPFDRRLLGRVEAARWTLAVCVTAGLVAALLLLAQMTLLAAVIAGAAEGRLGQRPPDLGRRPADLVHTLGGAPEVSMIGRSSTPPPGAGHSLANAKA